MKPKRNWTAKEKTTIVLEGLKGRPIVDICNDYGVSQTLYYKWKEKFLSNVQNIFEQNNSSESSREQHLLRENNKLKQSLAEAFLELKKIEEGW